MNSPFAYGLGIVGASAFGIIAIIMELEWVSLCGLIGVGTAYIIRGVSEDRKNDSSSEVKDE